MKDIAVLLIHVAILFVVSVIGLSISAYAYSDSETNDSDPPPLSIFSAENVTIWGALEIEGNYEDRNYHDPSEKDHRASNLSLASVDLGLDAAINKNISGHILFSYEDEEDAQIEIDEGFIRMDWPGDPSWYIIAGRQYVPFGNFESAFISDPLTLELGETRKTAFVLGMDINWIDISLGFFNGDVDKMGKKDNHIVNYLISANAAFSNDTFGEFGVGASYMNNIAESDTLSEEINTLDGTVDDFVGGYAASLLYGFKNFNVSAEYVWTAKDFQIEAFSFYTGKAGRPAAFTLEATVLITDDFYMGVRYDISKDGGDLLAEKAFGIAANYSLFEYVYLGAEVQALKYENKDKAASVIVQLALLF